MSTPVYLEVGSKKVFACALDWPGWARAAKTEEEALEALAAYVDRYRPVAEAARVRFPKSAVKEFDVVERVKGDATTDFGAPSQWVEADATPLTKAQAERLGALVEGAWTVFDQVRKKAPAELRKGPRGGGRDRDKMVAHVFDAENAYFRKVGVKDGRDAFLAAFEEVVGRPPEHVPSMSGRTDSEIGLELLRANGAEAPERDLPRFLAALAGALAAREDAIRADGCVLAGAAQAIVALAREPGVVQSLLTGNIRPNAALKLSTLGLGEGLDLEVGGYGSDDVDRSRLVAVARRRAATKYGEEVRPEDAVLIGDTPLDVAAAREAGARSVAVATGHAGREALAEARPDTVLGDLRDADALLAAVRTGRGA